jgi:type III secretory pathway component EscV
MVRSVGWIRDRVACLPLAFGFPLAALLGMALAVGFPFAALLGVALAVGFLLFAALLAKKKKMRDSKKKIKIFIKCLTILASNDII